MAQSITYISGSPMSGSPIIYRVKAEQITLSTDDNLTLHRLVLRIHAWLSTDTAANKKTYDYSVEVSSAEEVDFNISSALQSLAQTFTPQPATTEQTYPLVTYYLEAFDEYILNREKYTEQGKKSQSPSGYHTLLGRYTDMERLFNPAGITYLDERLLTHKPRPTSLHPNVQPEIVSIGENYLLPKVSGGISIKTPITSATAKAAVSPIAITTQGYRQLSPYRRVYAIDLSKSPDHYEFQFFNQLGVMESYCLQAARQTTVKATSTEYNHSIRETFSQLSRSLVRKAPGQEQWKLTSGPLDRHWLSWFIHDFLQAEYMWVKLTPYNSQLQGSYWVPCLIALDDNLSGLDLTKRGEPLTVTFTLKLDLAGSTQAAEHYEPFRFDTTPLDSTYRLAD